MTRLLPHDEVHVWTVRLERPLPEAEILRTCVPVSERDRAARLPMERHRRRFLRTRIALRRILAEYMDAEPCEIPIEIAGNGKPGLGKCGKELPPRFNLTHSHDLALVAVTCQREVGVDLEHVNPKRDEMRLARRFFHASETAYLETLARPERLAAFYRAWTRKEAYVKAIGEGLRVSPRRVAVTLAPQDPARLVAVDGRPGEESRWRFAELRVPEHFVGAVAAEGPLWVLKQFEAQSLDA